MLCDGWEAVEEFFGLDIFESVILFAEDMYDDPSKSNVIKRIREFVKEKEVSALQ